MKEIWKFPLRSVGVQHVEMPEGSEILCVQVQRGVPHIWAAVDPEAAKVKRTIVLYATGHKMAHLTAKKYVGTFQVQAGAFVFHVFSD